MCCSVLQSLPCVQIMRWWCSNLVQVLIQTYSSFISLQLLFWPLLSHLSQPFFWIFLVSFLYPTAPPSATFCLRGISLCSSCLYYPLPARKSVHMNFTHTRHPPAIKWIICQLLLDPRIGQYTQLWFHLCINLDCNYLDFYYMGDIVSLNILNR